MLTESQSAYQKVITSFLRHVLVWSVPWWDTYYLQVNSCFELVIIFVVMHNYGNNGLFFPVFTTLSNALFPCFSFHCFLSQLYRASPPPILKLYMHTMGNACTLQTLILSTGPASTKRLDLKAMVFTLESIVSWPTLLQCSRPTSRRTYLWGERGDNLGWYSYNYSWYSYKYHSNRARVPSLHWCKWRWWILPTATLLRTFLVSFLCVECLNQVQS